MRRKPKILHVFKFLILGALFITALGFGIRELWNCLIPDLFHGPVITFWQGLGLCLLGKLLFGWHHGGGPGGFRRGRAPWADKFRQKFENMTPEEREKMRERLRRCGGQRFGFRPDEWYNEEQPVKKEPEDKTDNQTNI